MSIAWTLGFYSIYYLKRKEIEHFIDKKDEHCLEPVINKIFEKVSFDL